MDFNSYFSKIWLQVGYYDTRTLRIDKKLVLMNRISILSSLICMIKSLIILLDFSADNRLRFYLIEIYLFEGKIQKIFDLGFFLGHGAIAYAFYYFGFILNKDLKLLKNLDFLFIENLDDLIAYYNLNEELTKKFIKTSKFYILLVRSFIMLLGLFFYLPIIRCAYVAVFKLNINCLCTLIFFFLTLFSYYVLTSGALKAYFLVFVSIDFLMLRLDQIKKEVLKRFMKKSHQKSPKNLKKKRDVLRTLQLLDNFVHQFVKIDKIFKNLIFSITICVCLAACCLPYFTIFSINLPIIYRAFTLIIYVASLIVLCLSLSFYNDLFQRKVRIFIKFLRLN